jgi:GTP-binding protein
VTQPTKPPPRIISAEFFAGAHAFGELPPPLQLEIAFAGRSNVGKSSLLNALTARKNLARTSSTPGCTRQISLFRAKADDGAEIVLADLPGYGYARRSKTERIAWGELIETYLLSRPTLRAVAVLVDIRRGLEEDELDLLRLLAEPARVARPALVPVIVGTKLDKIPSSSRKLAINEFQRNLAETLKSPDFPIQRAPYAATSVHDRESIQKLWLLIRRSLGLESVTATK